jgi:hypothetical protein
MASFSNLESYAQLLEVLKVLDAQDVDLGRPIMVRNNGKEWEAHTLTEEQSRDGMLVLYTYD